MIVVIRNKSELKIAYNLFPAIRYSLLSFFMQHTITHTITKYTEVYIILRVHFLRSTMVYGKSLEFTITCKYFTGLGNKILCYVLDIGQNHSKRILRLQHAGIQVRRPYMDGASS